MTTRIYIVIGGEKQRLVRASSQAQAIGHVVRNLFKASVATQNQIVDFMLHDELAEVENAVEEEKAE